MHSHITKTPINNKIIAIFDYDNEGFNEFKALKKSNIYTPFSVEGITFKNVLQHKDKRNVFAITLVPPPFREIYVHSDNSNYCYLTTELLLDDSNIPVANKAYPTLFDKSVFYFNGKKVSFAQKINERAINGEVIDFSGFSGTLEIIEKLVNHIN